MEGLKMRKRKSKNRLVSLLLCMMMIVTMIPVTGKVEVKAKSIVNGNDIANAALADAKNGYHYKTGGFCLGYCAVKYKACSGLSNLGYSAYTANDFGNKYLSSTSRDDIPIGAIVVFSGTKKIQQGMRGFM